MGSSDDFNIELVKSYPHADKKISLNIGPYQLDSIEEEKEEDEEDARHKCQTTFISPYGLEYQGAKDYPKGTLLKISISIPNYWLRKKKLVDYNRIDNPESFRILGKVISTQDCGKRGKKKLVLVQTVNIDEVDENILKTFLQEGK